MACGHQAGSVRDSGRLALIGIALGAALVRAWLAARTWIERSRQRRALADLDDRLLRDVGISRPAARREIDKLFWQP